MKKLFVFLAVAFTLTTVCTAQDSIVLPPDYYGEELRRGFAAWKNTGWVRGTDGDPVPDVEYVTDGATPRAFIKKNGALSLVLASIDTVIDNPDTLRRLDIDFDGPWAQYPDPIAQEEEGYHRNFHLPWCGEGGKTLVPGYRWIMYPEIYPEIDMYIYCGSRGQKLMFVIRPEGNPADLIMHFTGHDEMDIDILGNLRILLEDRWVVLPEAVAYQYDDDNDIIPVNWSAAYEANTSTGEVGFIFDQYDRYKPLVLLVGPPPLMGGPSVFTDGVCWSTYYGGEEDDFIFGSTIDGSGNYCVTGQTFSNNDFPIQAGTVLTNASPACIVARFNNNDNLLWSTIYGSTSGWQLGQGCARPGLGGEVFVGGILGGEDIPLPDGGQPSGRYVDVGPNGFGRGFLASFSLANGILEWSTFFGGSGSAVYNLDFDALSNLYVCGRNSGDLPLPTELTPPVGSVSWSHSGSADGFITKLSQNFKVWWSTYIGGTGYDIAYSVRVGANKVVVAGLVQSPSFQTLSAGGSQAHNFSSSPYDGDIFIEEFNLSGVQQWGSYFSYGGDLGFQGLALDDNNGDIFLAGLFLAGESSMPVSTSAPWYQTPNSTILEKSFIWQLGADHVRKYSTYVTGTGGSNWLRCIEVNDYGQIYAAGVSWATTMDAACWNGLYCELDPMGYGDAYIISLSPQHLRSWLTYFGGNTDVGPQAEDIRTIALKGIERLYVAGYTFSPYMEPNQFFPLHDELGGAWWDSDLDALSGCDAFVTAFCLDGVVGVSDAAAETTGLNAHWTSTGTVRVTGLPLGKHVAQVHDARGSLLAVMPFQADDEGTGSFDVGPLPNGLYLIRIGASTLRLISAFR